MPIQYKNWLKSLASKKAGYVLLMALSVIGALWKCRYGIELFDESFYLPAGFKLYSLGDRPFIDEINNGPRQLDLLNFLLVKPLAHFSVLQLRQYAVLFYAASLAFLTAVSFGESFGLLAAVGFSGLVSFDYLLVTTWSHNHWCRNLIVLHTACILAALKVKRSRGQIAGLFAAGICLGLAVIAYNTVLAAALLGLGFMAGCGVIGRNRTLARTLAIYFLGFALVVVADFTYLLRGDVWPYFKAALAATASVPDYAMNARPLKAWGLMLFCLTRIEFWFALFAWALAFWQFKWRGANYAAVAVALGALALRLIFASEPGARALSTWVGLELVAALVLGLKFWREKNAWAILSVFIPSATIFIMGMSSSGANGATVWVAPALVIPFLAYFTKLFPDFPVKPATLFMLGIVIVGAAASSWSEVTKTYHDLPPRQCTATLDFDPLRGIRTGPRRAQLLSKMDDFTQNHKFAFTDGALPMVFMLDDVRSSLDTIFIDDRFKNSRKLKQLKVMVARSRFPEILFHAKRHPWDWGIQTTEVFYNDKDVYHRFYECAKSNPIATLFEFDAYTTSPERVIHCVQRLADDPANY